MYSAIKSLFLFSLLAGNLQAQEIVTSVFQQKLIELNSPEASLPSLDLKLTWKTPKKDQEKRELLNVVKGVSLIFDSKIYEESLNPKTAFCNPPKRALEHTTYLGNESISPFVLYQVQIPINTLTGPSQSFSFKMNSGNSIVHQTSFRDEKNQLRTVNFDAVMEKENLTFTQPVGEETEAFVVLSFYSASEKGLINPLNWVVSDNFLESFHKAALGRDDYFGRKELGYDNYAYEATDPQGNTFSLDKGKIYAFPLQLGATQYHVIQESDKSLISVNGSAAIQIPFSKVADQQEIGAAVGGTFNATRKLSENNSLTGSLHGATQFYELGSTNNRTDAYNEGSNKPTFQSQALVGFNHIGKKGNTNSFYLTYNRSNLRLGNAKYKTTGDELNHQAMDAATTNSEFLEIGTSKTINFKNSNRLQVEIAIREDVFTNFGKIKTIGGHSPFVGRNAEDFGVFVGVRYQLARRKKNSPQIPLLPSPSQDTDSK